MGPEHTQRRLKHLGRLARLMDGILGVPGTRWRFGLDPAIGLVPVVGDLSSLVVAGWIVFEAWRLGARGITIVHMIANILIDAVIGSIPLLGDVADAFMRMNERNVRLLERDVHGAPAPGAPRSRRSAS